MTWKTAVFLAFVGLAGLQNGFAEEPGAPVLCWNEFRGPGGSGVGRACDPPAEIDPEAPDWQVDLAPGNSSPIIAGDNIVVTAVDDGRLVTLAFNKQNGREAWRALAPACDLERVHATNSPAASTPCADEQRIYVYFGSFGLICYDHNGNESWRRKMEVPRSLYGATSSPIIHGERLFMVIDNDANLPESKVSKSKVIALDRRTGKLVWETPRPFHRSGWSTPTVWEKNDHASGSEGSRRGAELVVLGNGKLRGYDIRTGAEAWFINGFSRETISRPIVNGGVLYASASMIGGVADASPDPEPFWKAVMQYDSNGDMRLQRSEMTGHFTFPFRPDLPPEHPGFGMPLPNDPAQRSRRLDGMFRNIDKDQDGSWSRDEFIGSVSFNRGDPNLVAVRAGGDGDISDSHAIWSRHRDIPECPTPLLYREIVYMVRDGGILAAVKASDGELIYRKRLGAPGHYRSSPVLATEGVPRLYALSEPGVLSVIRAGEKYGLLAQADFDEPCAATPAIGNRSIYIRTRSKLFGFRNP